MIAIQKNYIKGVWRQDAEEIEKLIKEEKIQELKLKAEQANENISGAVDVKEDFEDDYLKYHEDAF